MKNFHLAFIVTLISLFSFSHSINAMPHGNHNSKEGCHIASLKCAKAPSASFGTDGKLWLAWVFAGHVYVQHSVDNGQVFSPPLSVNQVPENIIARAENRVKIQLDKAGNIYLSWTQALSKLYTGNIRFSRSLDGGKTFSQPITVNDDLQEISHRFDALVVSDDGDVFISWLDKRDAQAAHDQGKEYVGGALYYSYSNNQGQSFSKNINLSDNACVCCRIAIALDKDNLPVIAWRDIYGNDINNQIRDHSLLTFKSVLKPAKKIRLSNEQWQIDGCPHHGPALAVDSNNRIHSTWFNDTDLDYVLFYGNSGDDFKAMGFGQADRQSSHPYVETLGETVLLVWKEFDGKKTEILMKVSTDAGINWGKEKVVTSTTGSSDHPILVKNATEASTAQTRGLYLSWHSELEGYLFMPLWVDERSTDDV